MENKIHVPNHQPDILLLTIINHRLTIEKSSKPPTKENITNSSAYPDYPVQLAATSATLSFPAPAERLSAAAAFLPCGWMMRAFMCLFKTWPILDTLT
jgi:hypothetical protein